ncbi:hypothetical protein B0H67DRAFT_498922, partial [Lasiosphaeris hirsuta]
DIKGPLGLNLLHEPSEARVNFIFVHGLGGGSKKTWSNSPDPKSYWPKEWLPKETGFQHVRIFSYGYNSDWTKREESRLTSHDYGQALLADISNYPSIRNGGDVSDRPITQPSPCTFHLILYENTGTDHIRGS